MQNNQVRIISGKHRGRKIHFPTANGLRPTSDRIRETLFNWLQTEIPGARCLDLFAGSGALGLEALSRGASAVDFVEILPEAAQAIKTNLAILGETKGAVYSLKAEAFLKAVEIPYDIIFLDPPFEQGLSTAVIEALTPCFKSTSLIYLEAPRPSVKGETPAWQLFKETQTKHVTASLYRP